MGDSETPPLDGPYPQELNRAGPKPILPTMVLDNIRHSTEAKEVLAARYGLTVEEIEMILSGTPPAEVRPPETPEQPAPVPPPAMVNPIKPAS